MTHTQPLDPKTEAVIEVVGAFFHVVWLCIKWTSLLFFVAPFLLGLGEMIGYSLTP